MISENHNKWKPGMEELDRLPGESLYDKNTAWEKLHLRLGKKKQSKKAVWYWAAAACILFALIIPAIIRTKNNSQIARVEIKQKKSQVKTYLAVPNNNKISAPGVNPALEEHETVVADNFSNSKNKMIPQKKINEIHLYDTVNSRNLVAENNNKSLQPVDTFSNVAAIIPVKQKLKVIQINELGDPQEFQPGIARNADKHIFQFKFGNQEIFTNPSVASSDKGFTILKIKTSSN